MGSFSQPSLNVMYYYELTYTLASVLFVEYNERERDVEIVFDTPDERARSPSCARFVWLIIDEQSDSKEPPLEGESSILVCNFSTILL